MHDEEYSTGLLMPVGRDTTPDEVRIQRLTADG
jgi:hypothetical protein